MKKSIMLLTVVLFTSTNLLGENAISLAQKASVDQEKFQQTLDTKPITIETLMETFNTLLEKIKEQMNTNKTAGTELMNQTVKNLEESVDPGTLEALRTTLDIARLKKHYLIVNKVAMPLEKIVHQKLVMLAQKISTEAYEAEMTKAFRPIVNKLGKSITRASKTVQVSKKTAAATLEKQDVSTFSTFSEYFVNRADVYRSTMNTRAATFDEKATELTTAVSPAEKTKLISAYNKATKDYFEETSFRLSVSMVDKPARQMPRAFGKWVQMQHKGAPNKPRIALHKEMVKVGTTNVTDEQKTKLLPFLTTMDTDFDRILQDAETAVDAALETLK